MWKCKHDNDHLNKRALKVVFCISWFLLFNDSVRRDASKHGIDSGATSRTCCTFSVTNYFGSTRDDDSRMAGIGVVVVQTTVVS